MTDERQPGHPTLLRGLSTDEDARQRQLANLRQGGATHMAYVEAVRAPLEAQHRDRLQGTFPGASATPAGDDLINASAKRLALLDRFSAFLDDKGPITARKGKADVEPAARELRLLLDAHERAVVQLAELEREHGAGGRTAAMEALMRGRGELPDEPPDAEVVEHEEDDE
jgi:hypothetical protein